MFLLSIPVKAVKDALKCLHVQLRFLVEASKQRNKDGNVNQEVLCEYRCHSLSYT